MNTAHDYFESGFSLLAVLITSALLGLFILTTFYLSYSLATLRGSEIHSALARSRAQSGAMEKLLILPPELPASRLYCESNSAKAGKHEIERAVCSLVSLATAEILDSPRIDGTTLTDPEQYPQVDYNSIFEAPDACLTEEDPPSPTTVLGFPLTPSAALSGRVCRGIPADYGDSHVVLSNLATDQDVSAAAGTIAAAGYLDINASLSIAEDLLLMAGGDLHIKELTSSGESLTATLASASGVVSVEHVSATVRLKIIAWSGIYVPPALPAIRGNSQLRFIPREILGLKSLL